MAAHTKEVVIRAPAKINVGLAVGKRRPDGYHGLETLFQAVSLYDRISLRKRRQGIRLVSRDFPADDPSNLAVKAAEIFFRETGLSGGVDIALEKRIPLGGGLGGGSSDGAAVLLGMSRLYGVTPSATDLMAWAAALGSDVPFFLTAGAALGRGRGELLESLPAFGAKPAVVIHAPPVVSSTAAVYGDYRPKSLTRRGDESTILLRRWRSGDPLKLGKALFNDLEETVFLRHPPLRLVKEKLLELGAFGAQVSGSGACIFGLFPDGRSARRAAGKIDAVFSGRSFTGRFLPPRRRWGVVKW